MHVLLVGQVMSFRLLLVPEERFIQFVKPLSLGECASDTVGLVTVAGGDGEGVVGDVVAGVPMAIMVPACSLLEPESSPMA